MNRAAISKQMSALILMILTMSGHRLCVMRL
jgi:hypothetical protein